jgi:hypothetical protein
MGTQRRINLSEIFRLGGTAVLCAAVWTAFYVTWLSARVDVALALWIGVAAAGAGVLLQSWDWRLLGGRSTVSMTNKWIRNCAIPPTIPQGIWVPLLRRREVRASKQWRFLIVVALEASLSIAQLVDPTRTDHVLWAVGLLWWVGSGVWILYYNLRWLPVIRRLLRQERAPEARFGTEDQDIHSR